MMATKAKTPRTKPKQSFEEVLNQNAAWARVELGMSRSEFDALEPREFELLFSYWERKQYREACERAHFKFLLALSAGITKEATGEAFTYEDFDPKPPKCIEKEVRKARSAEKRRRERASRPTVANFLRAFQMSGITVIDNRKKKDNG